MFLSNTEQLDFYLNMKPYCQRYQWQWLSNKTTMLELKLIEDRKGADRRRH
jgi:hypothetical protein